MGHFALPLWESQANVFPGLSKSVIIHRPLFEEATPFPACAPSIAGVPLRISFLLSATSHFPFRAPWGSPAPLYPGVFHN